MIARGDSRDDAAATLGISANRAKADLKTVFANYGVDSAAALSRRVAEIAALHGLAQACEVTVGLNGASSELLRFVPRRWASGRIAVVDHGPRGGRPVVILHSNVTGRHHPAQFITALQARGLRPIAFDRAGFGLTDPAPGTPTEAGVNDTIEVMAALDVDQPLVVARCCTASVIASHLSARGLVAGGVMLWPEGPRKDEHRGRDLVDRSRAMFTRFPGLARRFSEYVAAYASDAVLERVWRTASRGYPLDAALFDDPTAKKEILRGTKQAVIGLTGMLDEALELGLGPQPAAIDGHGWTLIYGDIEEDGDLSSAIAHWRHALPMADLVKLPSGGNFLHMTHCADVADRVAGACIQARLAPDTAKLAIGADWAAYTGHAYRRSVGQGSG
ncbi:hypothetical protein SPAN111604_09680 [Sphingomonas antarctica]|uniref:alpha/beta hydrolase n=1 Tax=Sphingomonas antarctica TaxID=2040274 RepID=UPI0039E9D4C1